MYSSRFGLVPLCLFLIAGLLFSYSLSSTPPGANSFTGSVEGSLYTYHYQEEGLGILVWHDFSFGESGCGGTSSTSDPIYRLECYAEASDGRRFTWEAHTRDGFSAQMWLNDDSYDLDQGSLFLVSSQDGPIHVERLQRDLAGLEPIEETFRAIASNDRDVADFIAKIETP